jgi:hypothetical protein
MINQELSLYIQAQLGAGMPRDVIKEILIARGGWRPEDVEQAFTALTAPAATASMAPVAPMQAAPKPEVQPAPAPQPAPVQAQAQPQTNFFAPKPAPVSAPTPAPAPVAAMQTPTPAPTPAPQPVAPVVAPMQPTPATPAQPAVSPFLKPTPNVAPVSSTPMSTPAPAMSADMSQFKPAATPMPSEIKPVAPQTLSSPVPPVAVMPQQAPAPKFVMSDVTFVKGSLGSPEPTPVVAPVQPGATPVGISPLGMHVDMGGTVPVGFDTMVAPPAPAPQPAMQQPATKPVQSFVGMQSQQDDVRITETKPKSKTGKIIFAIIALLVILGIGGGAAYAYVFYINPTPARAFASVVPKLESVQTAHYKATIVATFDKNLVSGLVPTPAGLTTPDAGVAISENPTAQATLTIDGSFDRTDSKNPKASNTLTMATNAIPLSLNIETRLVNGTFYAKVPDLGFLADILGGNTFGFVPGDWVEISKADIATEAQTNPQVSSFIPSQVTTTLTDDQQKQLMAAFLDGGVITPTVELAKDKVGTTSVHRYQFSVNQQALNQALVKAYRITTGAKDDSGEVAAAVGQIVDNVTIQNGELWVGVWDQKPYRLMFTVKPNGAVAGELQSITFDINLDSLGQPVAISAPVGAKPLISLIQDAQKKSKDMSIQSNLSAIKTKAELYYSVKRTYLGLCSAETGLKTAFPELTTMSAPQMTYCKDSPRTFAVAAELGTPASVACVDNMNSVTLTTALPTGTACK